MKILMISLDKKILDVNSRAAERMRQYGKHDEIFIIIPTKEKISLDLSSSVHIFSTGGNKLTQFFRLKILGNKIIKEQKIDLITTQDTFFMGLTGVLLKSRFEIPLEIQLHGDFYNDEYYKSSGPGNWLRYWLGRIIVLPRADKVRVVGERIRRSLIKLGVGEEKIYKRAIDTTKIAEFYGALPKPANELRGQYPGYEKIFVWAGRMDPVKNLSFLIDAFSEVFKKNSRYLLLLVGDGLQRLGLEKLVKKLNLEKNIKFIGWVYNPFIYLANADAVVFPSLSEGYGLVAMEAAAAGTPVIMTDVGVANYELKPGPKVKIVPVGDKNAFVKEMLEI